VRDWVHVERRALAANVTPPGEAPDGVLVVTIRPTASASARSRAARAVFGAGRVLRERFKGWQAAILTGNPPLARNLGIYAKRTHRVFNGTIECRLLRFELDAASEQRPAEVVRADWSNRPGAQMFANRLRKNLQRSEPWAEREHIECFRVYDADMPEYAFAIDLYGRESRHVYVQEYAPPKTVNRRARASAAARCWRCCPRCLRCRSEQVHSRVRKPQKGREQYEKRANAAERHAVRERRLEVLGQFPRLPGHRLFLDHRIMRADAARVGEGRGFPESVLLHGQRDGVCGRRRRAQHERRPVEHLSGLGARESACSTASAAEHELHRADCLAVAGGAKRPAARASI
jgi:23S rRNA (guanine2445-N2)-methyltransferase / 23S rRNA (guanine2069-N7)-methyltransferase